MPTGHSYIFFLSGIHKDCDFSGHGTHFRSHRMQACSYSMRRLWIPAFLFCVPDAHSVSGYPVFSTDAASASFFRRSFPASLDTQTQSHLHDFLLHSLQSLPRFSWPVLCLDVWHRPIFPVIVQTHGLFGISESVTARGTSGLCHWRN